MQNNISSVQGHAEKEKHLTKNKNHTGGKVYTETKNTAITEPSF